MNYTQKKFNQESAGIMLYEFKQAYLIFLLSLVRTYKITPDEIRTFMKGNFGVAFLKIDEKPEFNNLTLLAHSKIHVIDEQRLNKLNKHSFVFSPLNITPFYATEFVNNKNEIYTGATKSKHEIDIAQELEFYNRHVDTESKIIENIHKLFEGNKDICGKINLYTDLAPCSSCSKVLEKFSSDYPQIKLTVFHLY